MTAQRAATKKPWVDPDDAPEWTDDMLTRATLKEGDTIIRRSRPKPANAKVRTVIAAKLGHDAARAGALPAKRATARKKRIDPDDAPELTDEWFDRATLMKGDKIIRRGRPKLKNPKVKVTLRLDNDVIERFRNSGPGWQSRINAALRRHLARAKG